MIEFLSSIWTLGVKMATEMGDVWQAAIVGLLLSLAATQSLKPWLAEIVDRDRRRITIRALAFVAAAGPVLIIEPSKWGAIVAVCVGFLSPTFYTVGAWLVGKRWPDLAERLSAEAIAEKRREKDQ